MSPVPKKIVDGKVAVLVSPGYGAGWSTELAEKEALFDPTLVDLVLASKWDAAVKYVEDTYLSSYYSSAVENLVVLWVPVGTEFCIREEEGHEYIELKEKVTWITA